MYITNLFWSELMINQFIRFRGDLQKVSASNILVLHSTHPHPHLIDPPNLCMHGIKIAISNGMMLVNFD